jgi:hypothetical protein
VHAVALKRDGVESELDLKSYMKLKGLVLIRRDKMGTDNGISQLHACQVV